MYDSKKEYVPCGSIKFKSMSAALIKHEEDSKIRKVHYKEMRKDLKGLSKEAKKQKDKYVKAFVTNTLGGVRDSQREELNESVHFDLRDDKKAVDKFLDKGK
jgi:hypothetical protein